MSAKKRDRAAYMRMLNKKPEVILRRREVQKVYQRGAPAKARMLAYRARPDVRARIRARQIEYRAALQVLHRQVEELWWYRLRYSDIYRVNPAIR